MQIQTPLAERAGGVLLHITSLPSPWGVGDIGPRARAFAQRLGDAGLRYWQVLPLNPTTPGADESPYFSNSSRAGNPLLLSIEDLVSDGLLKPAEVTTPPEGAPVADFQVARRHKLPLLSLAARRLVVSDPPEFQAFCRREAAWLDDHALFTALSARHGTRWRDWPEPLKRRERAALQAAADELYAAVDEEKGLQYLFQRQWSALREHCAAHGVALFGDMPIYVNTNSVDVWAAPQVYQLDEQLNPRLESGVPPDYFSSTGQLWRNPVYDWDQLQADGFAWWIARLDTLLARLDLLRIDHFRGLAQYWAVPAGAETAAGGQWLDVPSHALFDALRSAITPLPLVAEAWARSRRMSARPLPAAGNDRAAVCLRRRSPRQPLQATQPPGQRRRLPRHPRQQHHPRLARGRARRRGPRPPRGVCRGDARRGRGARDDRPAPELAGAPGYRLRPGSAGP
jgi:4-alpha-glucanotransferase